MRLFFLLCVTALIATAKPYNLLVIQTDEHHFKTLGCYGGKVVQTPNIDWIAQHGAIATSFYATTPVCSPSRAAFMSGLYPHKTPVSTNNIPLDNGIVTFAEVLRRHGYATGYAGKWHLDGEGKPQWGPARQFGWEDNRFMFNRGHWKKFAFSKAGPMIGSYNKRGAPDYKLNGADEHTFATDWLANHTINFINKNKLERNVILKKFVSNPYPFLKLSDVFILSSNYEGLPNVLLEAQFFKKKVYKPRILEVLILLQI